jgi:hypothetical protein
MSRHRKYQPAAVRATHNEADPSNFGLEKYSGLERTTCRAAVGPADAHDTLRFAEPR